MFKLILSLLNVRHHNFSNLRSWFTSDSIYKLCLMIEIESSWKELEYEIMKLTSAFLHFIGSNFIII